MDDNCIQQLVDKLYKSLSSRHNFILFREFAGAEDIRWKLLEGTQVKHRDLGQGTVTRVYKGFKNEVIFIHINFPNPIKKQIPSEAILTSKEFMPRSGLVELIIPKVISPYIDRLWYEIDKRRASEQAHLHEQNQLQKQEAHKEYALKHANWQNIAKQFKQFSTAAIKKILTDFDLPEIEVEDLKLVCHWANLQYNEHTSFTALKIFLQNSAQKQSMKQDLERLISARLAEKVALNFYTRMGLPAEDVSVTQITNPQEGDWQHFDLQVGSDGIDVKNARPARYKNRHSQKYSYVELRVQKPGKISPASRRNIHIAGVLSPNFSLEHFLDPKTIPTYYTHRDITFLGTSQPNQLWKLKQEFTMQGFEIDFRRLYYGNQCFLPKWMFDYPADSYRIRDENLEKIKNITWPQDEMFWDEYPLNLAPCFLTLGEDYTKLLHWASYDDAEICFIQKILIWRRYTPPSLPFIFLTVLWHFVRMAQLHNTKWHPQKYRSLLFCNEKTDTRWPLFVYDPQETVNDLITTLENLWEHRQAVIQEFRQFKLAGAGILRGRSTSQDQWQTLVAYCGECYHHPLIWGADDTCQKCGRLYCSQCGYCSDACLTSNMGQEQVKILFDENLKFF